MNNIHNLEERIQNEFETIWEIVGIFGGMWNSMR